MHSVKTSLSPIRWCLPGDGPTHTPSTHTMTGKATTNGAKSSVYGGQTFNKAVFPPTKYIQGLLNAYCPGIKFDVVSLEEGRRDGVGSV